MIILGLVAGYFTLFAAGVGVALLIMRGSRRINPIECACLAWLFGVGVVSLLLWLGGMFASGIVLQRSVTAACVTLVVLGWRAKQRNQLHFSLPRPSSSVERVLAGLLLVELVTISFVSLKHTVGWDGLLNWEIKARYAFLNSGVLPGSYYLSPGRAFSHPEYPLALPLPSYGFISGWVNRTNSGLRLSFRCFTSLARCLSAYLFAGYQASDGSAYWSHS